MLAVDLGRGVRAGFTVAAAGEAPPNLSLTVGDAGAAARNRVRLALWAGGPLAFVYQVHGADVHVTDGPTVEPRPHADAVVAADGTAAVVLVADCVPVLLADADAGIGAAVHAGRRGVVAGVVPAAVETMARLGADPARVRAAVGPAICGACYEVPAPLRDDVGAQLPAAVTVTSWGTPALDLRAAVAAQLTAAGIRDVQHVGGCTLEDPRWFSHRGLAVGRPVGRLAAVVRVEPVAAR